MVGRCSPTSQNRENQISRYLTVQIRIEILIGFEFRCISRYKFKLRFWFNVNMRLTKISPPFRISICISLTISSLIFSGTGCMRPLHVAPCTLLRICRALLRICRALLRIYRALLRIYRALLQICRGLALMYRALLRIYRALWQIYRGLLWTAHEWRSRTVAEHACSKV